ncbi:hypothetical protein [Paraburkholderia sediminicola]|uniref:hypothetical protein n=1 Tax=Paraburkholderia sediminicola TaxID=458836 RepID=UPI0038BDFD60
MEPIQGNPAVTTLEVCRVADAGNISTFWREHLQQRGATESMMRIEDSLAHPLHFGIVAFHGWDGLARLRGRHGSSRELPTGSPAHDYPQTPERLLFKDRTAKSLLLI